MAKPVEEMMQGLLQKLRSTGAPAFTNRDLAGLCASLLEALDQSMEFEGCLSRGGAAEQQPVHAVELSLQLCCMQYP
jgi:hypothetical protein